MLSHYIFSGSVRLVNFHNRLVLVAVDYNVKPDILTSKMTNGAKIYSSFPRV